MSIDQKPRSRWIYDFAFKRPGGAMISKVERNYPVERNHRVDNSPPSKKPKLVRLFIACLLMATLLQTLYVEPYPASAASVVLVGAGDISTCGNNNDEATAKLLDGISGT